MRASADRGDHHRFTPTSGTVIGWFGLGMAAVVLVVILVDDRSLPTIRFALGVAIFGLLVWCYFLRPRVVVGAREVELRNAFSSWHVPLADVRTVTVRAVTRVHTDDGRYDGVAVGRPVRSLRRGTPDRSTQVGIPGLDARRAELAAPAASTPKGQLDADGMADFVVDRILLAADRARSSDDPGAEPRRTWARWELGALAALVAALVVALLV